MARLIDGKKLGRQICDQCQIEAAGFQSQFGLPPKLTVIIIGDDPASQTYVAAKKKKAQSLGMDSEIIALAEKTPEPEVLAHIERLNQDETVHGILVQLPLPDHLDRYRVISAISPFKDVDGLTPHHTARLALGLDALNPCTPAGCVMLAKSVEPDLTGAHAVIIGRSALVGRPLAALLLRENCTITTAHSKTKNLAALSRTADILIAAAGTKHLVRGDWVAASAIIIDVGIHRISVDGQKRLTGDVAFDEVAPHVRAITPVPGGVGPMTVACLMANTMRAALWQRTQKLAPLAAPPLAVPAQ